MKKHALLIGINGYRHDSRLTPLKYAEADAMEMAAALSESCGFDTNTLVGPDATRDAIEGELMSCGKGYTFVFFFAGHGQRLRGQYKLHAVDSNADGLKTVSFEDLSSFWHHAFGYKQIFAMIDACRSELAMARGQRGLDGQTIRDIGTLAQGDRWVEIVYACSEGQVSYEDDNLRHGVFTHVVLEVLRNASGGLSTETLAGAAADKMREWSKSDTHGRVQEPYRYSRPSLTERIELIAEPEEPAVDQGVSSATDKPLDPQNFKVFCWETKKWRSYAIGKMAFSQESDYTEITNSTFVHKHAMLVFDKLLSGDFVADVRLSGGYNYVLFIAPDGPDHTVSCPTPKQGIDLALPHHVIIRRKNGELSFFKADGTQMYKNIHHLKEEMPGFLALNMNNNHTVRIYRWRVSESA